MAGEIISSRFAQMEELKPIKGFAQSLTRSFFSVQSLHREINKIGFFVQNESEEEA